MDVVADLGLTVAVASALAAGGAWRVAIQSQRSNEKSAQATADLTALEQSRQWVELTPRFRFTLTEGQNGMDDQGLLEVELEGPIGLDYLDEVVIKIADEKGQNHWGARLPPDVTEEEAARFVWGPWEFNALASQQVSDNRTTLPQKYSRIDGRNWDSLDIRRTRPGHWMGTMTDEWWQQQRKGHLRLAITCRKDLYPEWFLLLDVPPGESFSHG